MRKLILFVAALSMFGCTSGQKKPDVGQCIQKKSSEYGETIYEILSWDDGVFPNTSNKKTGRVRVLTEYSPARYEVVSCP